MRILLGAGAIALVGCAVSSEPVRSNDVDPTRPIDVPSDYVRTPFGYFHPACVGTSDVHGARGQALGECTHEHYGIHPHADDASSDGWKASEWFETTPMYWISGSWTVPAAPAVQSDQVLYYFPSLEPGAYDDIVQPVLAWNGYGDQAWTMASWNCCQAGNVWHSAPISVTPGDTVWGRAAGGSCNAAGVCTDWTIVSGDTTTDQTTTLTATTTETFTAAQGGVLETYGVTACGDLAEPVTFTDVIVGTVGGHLAYPAWSPDIASVSPACGYAATETMDAGHSTVTVH